MKKILKNVVAGFLVALVYVGGASIVFADRTPVVATNPFLTTGFISTGSSTVAGALTVTGTCTGCGGVSGGVNGLMAAFTGASSVAPTSTPTVARVIATSTTLASLLPLSTSTSITVLSNAWFGSTGQSFFSSTGALTLGAASSLGTPTSLTLTNATGLPIAGINGLGTGMATFFATPSSANFMAAITDETGSGLVVGATLPTLSGFTSNSSSTIGDGTQAGGATIAGGSTTTKTALFQQGISGTEASTTYATTVNFLFATMQNIKIEMTGSLTLNLVDTGTAGLARKAIICQDASGSRTLTVNSSSTLIWAGHTVPTFTTTANECDILSFYTTGATGTVRVLGAISQAF